MTVSNEIASSPGPAKSPNTFDRYLVEPIIRLEHELCQVHFTLGEPKAWLDLLEKQ